MLTVKNVRVLRENGGFEAGEVRIENGRFVEEGTGGETLDGKGCYAVPGLIDVHLHGCVGFDFTECAAADMEKMLRYQAANGVTALCPATLTLSEEALTQAIQRMIGVTSPAGASLVGVHLEGPFISPQKLGAQNPAYVRAPELALYRRLQKAAGGMVRLLSLAPEMPGALDFIREVESEVTCSVAHTTADYDQAMAAFQAGARHVTHLYNAMPPFHHRDPGVIGAALDTPGVMVELICDGVHIHPSMVRATFRMFGAERIVLVSDSMMATGLEDGAYSLGGLPVQVQGNRATLQEAGNIAGSVTNLMDCVRTAVLEMGLPLEQAIRCATINPARSIGIEGYHGSVTLGKIADLVLLREDLSIQNVILRGIVQ